MKKSIKQLDREVKAVVDRVAKMKRDDCAACGKKQPHQKINGVKTCWRCGSY